MKLGLLGFDDSTAAVALAASRLGDRVAVAADLPAGVAWPVEAPALPAPAPWEVLLDAAACDAVIVAAAGWSDERSEAVRKLVQAGRALVLAQPLDPSMLFAYELEMIRRDSGSVLIPILPDRLHPFVARLRNWIEVRLPEGAVESITLERRLADRSRREVLRWFCRDSDLVRALVGAPGRLSTLGAEDPEAAWSTLAVGLTCPGRPPVRWQVAGGGSEGLSIRVAAAGGGVVIDVPGPSPEATGRPWTWTESPRAPEAAPPFDRGAAVLGILRDTIAGRGVDGDSPPATWDDAGRGVELAETVPRSLAKGRGIDLHQEEFTEIGTFKGTMASLGCGIVLLALLLVVVATVIGGIARQTGWEWGERLAGIWPWIALSAMGLFLLLQFLPLLVAPASPSRPADDGREKRGKTGKP